MTHQDNLHETSKVVQIKLTDGSCVYDVHTIAYVWDEDLGEMVQARILISCTGIEHATALADLLQKAVSIEVEKEN